MFRPATSGDWASDEDEDTAPSAAPTPPPAPASAWQQGPPPKLGVSKAPEPRESRERPQHEFVRGSREPLQGRWARPQPGADDRDRDQHQDREDRDGRRGYGRRESGQYQDRFDRDRDAGFDRFDRDRDVEQDRGFERERGGFDRRDRGGYGRSRRMESPPPADLPAERGTVVSLRENFGFISCVSREGDLFFHMSEAPMDIEVQDEVEFRVRFNQRSDKNIAVQLVKLPRGSIVWESIEEDWVTGTVTKGIPRSSFHGSNSFGSGREEPHGLIQVQSADPDEDKEDHHPDPDADADVNAPLDPDAQAAGQKDDEKAVKTGSKSIRQHHRHVRYTAESCAVSESEDGAAAANARPRVPHLGDDVRFRVATHLRTKVQRAVDLTITRSARDKRDREIDQQLDSMTREHGIVQRLASGGGFIRCCARVEDVYFASHELRSGSGEEDQSKPEGSSKKTHVDMHEGDEVSFFVMEDRQAASRSARLSAYRVVKLPPGTVSFEDLVEKDVEGVVTKLPRESRSGPPMLGMIHPIASDSVKTEAKSEVDNANANVNVKLLSKTNDLGFYLSDIADTASYIAGAGDVVVFDKVMDKRSGKYRAANVRLVRFNPQQREQGVITALKDDFGFIKCADRAGDAYFRFTDVLSRRDNVVRVGVDVAFDVEIDTKKGGDSIRATRIEILPTGSVQWETILEAEAEGEITLLPSRNQSFGSRGGKHSSAPRPHAGRILVTLKSVKHLVEFFPELKALVDATLLATSTEAESTNDSDAEKEEKELRVVFPSSLSKYERAAIHEYCDWLGVKHESSGTGASRHLEIVTQQKIDVSTLDQTALAPATTNVEFSTDDLVDVRYNSRIGDIVRLKLVLQKRSKQVMAKDVVLVTPASKAAKSKAAAAATSSSTAPASRKEAQYSELPKGEGVILNVKPEGFGFIQPADQSSGPQENLFFHVKEILTGETTTEIKPGMEAQYYVMVDDKRKKSRAVGISIVPNGTIVKVDASSRRGIVSRASLLRRMRPNKPSSRMTKSDSQTSSPGRIHVELDNTAVSETTGDANGSETKATKGKKSTKKETFTFFVHDVADPAVIVREGDEVEFVPQSSAKGFRATKIRVIQSHAKRGVVVQAIDGSHGVIRVDSDTNDSDANESADASDSVVEIAFSARDVLRGDVLKEGDHVEFVISKRPQEKMKPSQTDENDHQDQEQEQESSEHEEEGEKENNNHDEENDEEIDVPSADSKKPARSSAKTAMMLVATSILCLEPNANRKATTQQQARPENRSVNATLRQAMRQVGASATAESRMAKGPDGSKGFKDGWRLSQEQGQATVESISQDDTASTE